MNLISGTGKIIEVGEIKEIQKNGNYFLPILIQMEYFGKKELKCWGRKAKEIIILIKEGDDVFYMAEWKENHRGEIEFNLKSISKAFEINEREDIQKTSKERAGTKEEKEEKEEKEIVEEKIEEVDEKEKGEEKIEEKKDEEKKLKVCYDCGLFFEVEEEFCSKCRKRLEEVDGYRIVEPGEEW